MPSRILREGILTSRRVNRLSKDAEIFYRRLMSKVDDDGRWDGRPEMLRAALYPLRVDSVSVEDCVRMCTEVLEAGLVVWYPNPEKDGDPVLQMLDTKWQIRPKKSRFPDPPVNIRTRPFTLVMGYKVLGISKHIPENPVVPVYKSEPEKTQEQPAEPAAPAEKKSRRKPLTSLPPDFGISKRVRDWAYENGFGLLERHLAHFLTTAKAKDYQYADWDAAFEGAIRDDWAKLRVGTPKDDAAKKEWWESAEGIVAHGAGLDPPLVKDDNELFPYFKLRVFAAAGEGPWNKRK